MGDKKTALEIIQENVKLVKDYDIELQSLKAKTNELRDITLIYSRQKVKAVCAIRNNLPLVDPDKCNPNLEEARKIALMT